MSHGGARPNAGRPQEKVKLGKPGTVWVLSLDGDPDRALEVVSVSDNEIEFKDAETKAAIVLKKPPC